MPSAAAIVYFCSSVNEHYEKLVQYLDKPRHKLISHPYNTQLATTTRLGDYAGSSNFWPCSTLESIAY